MSRLSFDLARSALPVEFTPLKNLARALSVLVFAMEPSIHALARLRTIGRQLDHFEAAGVHERESGQCDGKPKWSVQQACDN